MNPIERFVIELTGRRYQTRRQTIWGLTWRLIAAAVTVAVIWLALVVAFL